MATHGAMKATRIAANAAGVVGIELLTAIQGIDFHAPLRTSPSLNQVVRQVRSRFPHYEQDRYLADELAWAKQAVLSGSLSAEPLRSFV
jgi:histidine ammonia-lyase